jgi:hypothetical protein
MRKFGALTPSKSAPEGVVVKKRSDFSQISNNSITA